MPRFSVLHDVSLALQSQIIAALRSAPDVSLDASVSNIVISPPSDTLGDDVLAVLYLYHFGIDASLRNQSPLPDRDDPALFVRPPLPLHLRYLFVPLSDDEESNQLMLGRVLQHFYDQPTFRPAPGTPLAQDRGGVPDRVRVRPDLAGFEALSTLWSALARPYRLSAGFLVDVAGVDSGLPAQATPRVGETFAATRPKALGEVS
ncbi:MAG: DUF4255 domain-containing protein [Rhodobacterales bacterium]|nr:DUF4255 domain-containing protein [Rhodobacterales bacterium]